jgi:hypothetical protein
VARSSRFTGVWIDRENSRLLVYVEGTEVARFDNAGSDLTLLTNGLTITAGGLAITAGGLLIAAGAIGYKTGAGGAVTQQTDKGTGVTLSKVTGTITTDNAALAAAAEVTFTVTNTEVAIGDTIVLSIQSGGTSGEYLAHVTDVGAGVFDITLANMSASSASDAVLINFAVIKAVSA